MTKEAEKLGEQCVSSIALQNGLSHDCHVDAGLTLRQHFAGLAMQGMCSETTTSSLSPHQVASMAIQYADALLEELAKPI